MKSNTWATTLLNKIFNMTTEIYTGCKNCGLGVNEHWEEFNSSDKDGAQIKGVRRAIHKRKVELSGDIPEVGQPIIGVKCPNDCPENSLIRI